MIAARSAIDIACPLEKFFLFLAKRWTLHIIWSLGENGELAFGQLARTLPGAVSAKVLIARLRNCEQRGLVIRREAQAPGQPVGYRLSSQGRQLHRLLQAIDKRIDCFPAVTQ
jgi:DNA-binding HxlR family transcriptional regulator